MSFSSTATVIKDVFSNKFIVCETCDQTDTISHKGVSLVSYGLGNWMEDIDDLSKTITIKGPILTGENGMGYTVNISKDEIYMDIFTWVKDSIKNLLAPHGYKVYVLKEIEIDISDRSTISVVLQSNTPFMTNAPDSSKYLSTTFKIYDYTVDGITQENRPIPTSGSLGPVNPSARILRNYDIRTYNRTNLPLYWKYLESYRIKYTLDWTDVKSIPTVFSIPTPIITRKSTNYKSPWDINPPGKEYEDQGPFIIQKVINNVACEINSVTYYEDNYTDYFEREVGTLVEQLPVSLLNMSAFNSSLDLTNLLSPETVGNVIFASSPYFMHWRLTNKSLKASGNNLMKVSETWKSVNRTNAGI